LGVLCDLVEPEGWEKTYGTFYNHKDKENIYHTTTMPAIELMDRVGLPVKLSGAVAKMNDRGNSFYDIAVYLREHLPVTDAEGAVVGSSQEWSLQTRQTEA
jgi:hypothetical protein